MWEIWVGRTSGKYPNDFDIYRGWQKVDIVIRETITQPEGLSSSPYKVPYNTGFSVLELTEGYGAQKPGFSLLGIIKYHVVITYLSPDNKTDIVNL